MYLKPINPINHIQPISLLGKKSSGRTEPLEIQCKNSDNQGMSNYIIKLYTSLGEGFFSCAKEAMGSILANSFELNTPDPAIIEIKMEFCTTVNSDTVEHHRLLNSLGPNFASKLIETEAMEFLFLPNSMTQEAFEVFAFDTLIMNPDRRKDRPNMFQQSSKLIVYDHEMAFSYANLIPIIGGTPEPWEINSPVIKTHALFPYLKGKKFSYDNFMDKLGEISDDFVDIMISQLPNEWKNETGLLNIRRYLLKACLNKDRYLRGLKEVLS